MSSMIAKNLLYQLPYMVVCVSQFKLRIRQTEITIIGYRNLVDDIYKSHLASLAAIFSGTLS